MEKLTCIFPNCFGTLINGSFVKNEEYVYLTCSKCLRRQIIRREDYNNHIITNYEDNLKKWL